MTGWRSGEATNGGEPEASKPRQLRLEMASNRSQVVRLVYRETKQDPMLKPRASSRETRSLGWGRGGKAGRGKVLGIALGPADMGQE